MSNPTLQTMELPSPPPPSPRGATDTDMTPDREYVTPSEESLSSGEDADIDKKGNPISVDNTNAISLPSDDPIGLAEFLNKGDVTSLDSQSNDATDGATVAAAAAVDTVAHTVSFADAVADATAEGDAASGSDSATDGVDSTAALISTTTDANGAVSESTVATNDITVNEPTTSTTTTSIVTTTDTSAPRTSVEEAIIATTENVVVSNTIVFAQDTVHFNETVAHVIAVKITSVDVIDSPPVTPAEDAAASETPSVTTVGTVAETTTAALLAQDAFNILSDSVVDDEPDAKEEIAPQLPATVTDTTAESTLEVEPKAAVQKSTAAREETKTQLPSHSSIDTPINTCSYVYSKGRRQCSKGVLTVSSGPYFCQIHRRHGSHGGFIYYNEHISILLVKDFKVLAERYPGKRRKLRAKIKEHFKMLFKDPERNLRGLSRTITDERTFVYVKKGFLYIIEYTRSPEEEAQRLALKIGSASGRRRFRRYYQECDVRGKVTPGSYCQPVAIFPSSNTPEEERAGEVIPFIWLFEKIIHCIYDEFNYNNVQGTFKCDNPKCKVQNHEEVYALPLNGKSREVAFESYQKEIVANMEVWLPFLRSLADGPLIYALCKTLDPSYGV